MELLMIYTNHPEVVLARSYLLRDWLMSLPIFPFLVFPSSWRNTKISQVNFRLEQVKANRLNWSQDGQRRYSVRFCMFKISGPGVWKKIINTCVYTHTHAHQEAKCISFKSWVSTLPNNLRGEAQALISSQSCNCFTTSLVMPLSTCPLSLWIFLINIILLLFFLHLKNNICLV